MAGIKISALPAAAASQLTDTIPAVQTGITKKETLQQIVTLFNSNIQLASSAQVTGLDAELATFLPLSGGTMAGPLLLWTNSPATDLEAASKGYVDTVASGFTVILATQAATTANLNATSAGAGVGATLTNAGAMAAFSVDGYAASVNDRILVKNQTLSQHNGVYVVTTVGSGAANWVLTRATDYDQVAEIHPGTLVAVNNGTVNAGTSWLETATVTTVDTDPILFSQFTFSSTSVLLKANNLSDVASASTSRTNLGLGTAATKTASDNTKTNAVMLNAAPSVGHIAIFTDVNGTVGDGGLPATINLNDLSDGRLTLTSGVPVTTSDVTGAATVYYTPYIGNNISLYDGADWNVLTFTELSIAVPATTDTVYDFFIYDNAGTATPELQPWTNTTTRAVGLVRQDGVYVKASDATRKYVGSFSTTSVAGQTEDSLANRYLWNYYNRVNRAMKATDATASWTYSLTAYRQARASTANQLNFLLGKSEDDVLAHVTHKGINSTITQRAIGAGIGLDRRNANDAITYINQLVTNAFALLVVADYVGLPAEGRHYLAWLEVGAGGDTQTFVGDNGPTLATGITGNVRA